MRLLKYITILFLWVAVVWPLSCIAYMLVMKLPHTFIPFSPLLGFIVFTKPSAWPDIFNLRSDVFVYITVPFIFFWTLTAILSRVLWKRYRGKSNTS